MSMSDHAVTLDFRRDNGNVHRAAAKIIVSKSRAARGSVCNVLLYADQREFQVSVSNAQVQQSAIAISIAR